MAKERDVELAREERLALLIDRIHFEPVPLDLLLHLVAACALAAEAKEKRAAAAGAPALAAHGEGSMWLEAHGARTLPQQQAPRERVVARAPRRPPALRLAKPSKVRLR